AVTVTVKEQVLVLPALSTAVQTTGVVPMGNVEPETGAHVTVAVPQLSIALGVANVTTAEVSFDAAATVMLGGQEVDGPVLSSTVIVALQVFDAPRLSTTVSVTGV